MNHLRVALKLLANGIRYRWLRSTGRAAPLQALSLEVTHRCFCRCRMCNIWQIPPEVPDLPLSAWVELLSSPELRGLRELDITGGEPFLRKDLGELLAWVCHAKGEHLPQLRTVAITTNGILTERVLAVVGEIAGAMQARGVDLVLACGMDAVGELHDRIRNTPGAWLKLRATLAGLQELRAVHANLVLGIKTTVLPMNVYALHDITRFAREQGLFTIISPCIITANRFGNRDLAEQLRFDAPARQALARFYQGEEFAWSGHRQAMLKYLETGTLRKPCSAGFNTLFVRHTGEVFPCPVMATALGNIRQEGLTALLSSPPAQRFRRGVGAFAECRTCTEPGLERIAWPCEGFTCLRQMLWAGPQEFDRLVGHMGLDKYL